MVTGVRLARRVRTTSIAVIAGLHLMAVLLGGMRVEASPPTAATTLLARWNEIGRKLITIADDLPEEKYAYKPHPDARLFVDQLLHAAGAMASFADRVEGRAERYPCDPTGNELRTKAEVTAFVRRGVSEGAELLRAADERGLSREIGDGSAEGVRLDDLANELIEHSGEH